MLNTVISLWCRW